MLRHFVGLCAVLGLAATNLQSAAYGQIAPPRPRTPEVSTPNAIGGANQSNTPRPLAEIEKSYPPKGSVLTQSARRELAIEHCAAKASTTKSEVHAALNLARARGAQVLPPRGAELIYCYSERIAAFEFDYRQPGASAASGGDTAQGAVKLDVAQLPNLLDAPPLAADANKLRERLAKRIELPGEYVIVRSHPSSKLFFLGGCGSLDLFDAKFSPVLKNSFGACSVATTIRAMAISKDGTTIALGMQNGDILVGDALRPHRDREAWRTCLGHTRHVMELVFADDGKFLLSSADDSTARSWKTESCEEEKRLRSSAYSALSASGHRFSVSSEGSVSRESLLGDGAERFAEVGKVNLGKVLLNVGTQALVIAEVSGKTVSLDLERRTIRNEPRAQSGGSGFENLSPAAFGSDGRLFGYVRGLGKATAYIYDTRSSAPEILQFELAPNEVASIEFVPNAPNLMLSVSKSAKGWGSELTIWSIAAAR